MAEQTPSHEGSLDARFASLKVVHPDPEALLAKIEARLDAEAQAPSVAKIKMVQDIGTLHKIRRSQQAWVYGGMGLAAAAALVFAYVGNKESQFMLQKQTAPVPETVALHEEMQQKPSEQGETEELAPLVEASQATASKTWSEQAQKSAVASRGARGMGAPTPQARPALRSGRTAAGSASSGGGLGWPEDGLSSEAIGNASNQRSAPSAFPARASASVSAAATPPSPNADAEEAATGASQERARDSTHSTRASSEVSARLSAIGSRINGCVDGASGSTVSVSITVARGRVVDQSVRGVSGGEQVACVRRVLAGLTFPSDTVGQFSRTYQVTAEQRTRRSESDVEAADRPASTGQ